MFPQPELKLVFYFAQRLGIGAIELISVPPEVGIYCLVSFEPSDIGQSKTVILRVFPVFLHIPAVEPENQSFDLTVESAAVTDVFIERQQSSAAGDRPEGSGGKPDRGCAEGR